MNERIKELAKKAGGNPNYKAFRGHPLPPPPDYIDPATVDLEKFAELIVRECIDICQYHPSNIVTNNWHGHDVAQDILQQFEKHFGVEE